MKSTATLTLRLDRHLLDYIRERAIRHDRSMNGEVQAVLREMEAKEKASGPAVESKPDASQK
ncbi:Arc family DNA-binding protein [Acetobacter okinawensis]|uniref:Arc family DNA-binding protein n=1 Tax=Acetobacter okinawensis TaxID=1076594 RepID=UPI0039E97AEF